MLFFRILGEGLTFTELDGVQSLGRIGSTGSYVDQSTIKDRIKRYIGGVKDTEEFTMNLFSYASDENQGSFLSAADQSKNIEFKVVFPVDENGQQLVALFEIATSGYSVPETSDANKTQMYEVACRQSGKPTFAFASDNNTASTSAVTITTAGKFGALDGDFILTQGKEFVTNGSGIKASINVTLAAGIITVATVVSGGLGHKVDDIYTVVSVGGTTATTQAELTVSEVS